MEIFKTICILTLLIAGQWVQAQIVNTVPRILSIGDIPAVDLFKTPDDITDPTSPWNGPLDASMQSPQSHRTMYFCYNSPNTPSPVSISVVLSGAIGVATTYSMKLTAPFLEIDPWQCANTFASATGDCRCNNPLEETIPGNPFSTLMATLNTLKPSVSWSFASSTYFEHSPFPGQNPYMRTYRKLCVQSADDALLSHGNIFRDTTVWIAVVHCCSSNADCVGSAISGLLPYNTLYSGNRGTSATFTAALSYSYQVYTGIAFTINGVPNVNPYAALPDTGLDLNWKCNREGYLGAFFSFNNPPVPVLTTSAVAASGEDCWGETAQMTVARQARSVCCGANAVEPRRGTCTNPKTEGCCGWKPFNPKFEQCCSKRTLANTATATLAGVRINYIDQPCRCSNTEENNDCKFYGANIPASLSTTDSGAYGETVTTPVYNSNRFCCTITKYPEFNTLQNSAGLTTVLAVQKFGQCYDNRVLSIQCCDDGHLFDVGTQQCCVINGVQSLNIPCPCNENAHCVNSGITDPQASPNLVCCTQQWPRKWEDGQGPNGLNNAVNTPVLPAVVETSITGQTAATIAADNQIWPIFASNFYVQPKSHCNIYSNWPAGQSPIEVQRCLGSCIDKRFQTCCNGQICVKNYERCCNSTCCNRFTSGCMEGTRSGSVGFGGRINPVDYNIPYETCTSIEVFTTRRAFWVWVMPTFWTVATVVSLAVVVVVARRATENVFPLTERLMVFFAVVLIGLCIPHYFAPTYKYGIVIVFTSMFAIVGAVVQSPKMSFVTVILVILMLGLWFDPFNGNIYMSLPGGFSPANVQNVVLDTRTSSNYYSGILEALFENERHKEECTGFYDYFLNDPAIHDFQRYYNPAKTTFGFCTRAWMSTLLIFSIITLACLLVLLTLSIFSLAKKLLPKSDKEEMAYELPLDAVPVY